jgi:hypothetical protein
MSELSKDFSKSNVEKLNEYQNNKSVHPFTCNGKNCKKTIENNFGILIATEEGWICQCSDYKQHWFHSKIIKLTNI